METDEIWMPMLGYEGMYEASSLGNLRSIDRIISHAGHGTVRRRSVVLAQNFHPKTGYAQSIVSKNGVKKTVLPHQVICEAFNGPRPEGMVVRHLDGVKAHNHASNLCWGTHKENYADQLEHGHRANCENAPNAKLRNWQVLQIRSRALSGNERQADIGADFGITQSQVSEIKLRKSWADL